MFYKPYRSEMKSVLIISPHFPPVNAPDMQRIRMSLPYYGQNGWRAEVICVDPEYVPGYKDLLLSETVPAEIPIHRVRAMPQRLTRKIGFGSVSIRSFYQIWKKGNELLRSKNFDLVLFSTSNFHVLSIGPYWKRKFGVPFIVDLQDPWRNDFHLASAKKDRPPKYRLAHALDSWMEARTMPHASGILAVTNSYIQTQKRRYVALEDVPADIIPIGASRLDFDFLKCKHLPAKYVVKQEGRIHVVYIGAVPPAFLPLLRCFFAAFTSAGIDRHPYHFYFIGTDYSVGSNKSQVKMLAEEFGLDQQVTEIPGRIPYFSVLANLQQSDIIFIPGSKDAGYTASKIFNSLLCKRPVFSIFHEDSLVKKLIEECRAGIVVGINEHLPDAAVTERIAAQMEVFNRLHLLDPGSILDLPPEYDARYLAGMQTKLFDEAINFHLPAARRIQLIKKYS